MNEETKDTQSPLEAVQSKFKIWRASRTSKRQHIPDELWKAAKRTFRTFLNKKCGMSGKRSHTNPYH